MDNKLAVRIVKLGTAVILVLMMIFPPLQVVMGGSVASHGYGFLFTIEPYYSVNVGLLFLQLAVVFATGYFLKSYFDED